MANIGRPGGARPHRDHPIAARTADLTWRLLGLTATAAASSVVDSLVIRTLAQGLIITAVTMAPQRRPDDIAPAPRQDRAAEDPTIPLATDDGRAPDLRGGELTERDPAGARAAAPPWGTPPPDPQPPIPAPRTPAEQRLTVFAVYTCTGRVQVSAYELHLRTHPGQADGPAW